MQEAELASNLDLVVGSSSMSGFMCASPGGTFHKTIIAGRPQHAKAPLSVGRIGALSRGCRSKSNLCSIKILRSGRHASCRDGNRDRLIVATYHGSGGGRRLWSDRSLIW